MIIGLNKQRRQRAHILLTSLVMAVTIAIAVGSFAILVTGQNKSIARSMVWNQCIPVAESGVEDALTQLYHKGTNTPGNGWIVTNGVYSKQRSIGTNGSYYTVTISPTKKPVITAVGYVPQPLQKTKYLARTVQVTVTKPPAPRGGVVARGTVTFTGGAYIDSFDSSDPNYSTNGVYTPSKRKDNGQIISNSGSAGAITMTGGSIYGYAVTGPTGSVAVSGSAAIGDATFIDSNSKGVQAGHVANNANVDFPAVQIPKTGGSYSPTGGSYNGTNYNYLLQNAKYYTSSGLKVGGGQSMAVVGDVSLYVDNDFTTGGTGYIYMYPGSSLKLYVSGGLNIGGGGIVNTSLTASQLALYGANTTPQSWSYSGGGAFVGTVYAPNCDFKFSGGADVTGSFTVNNLTVVGTAGIHFDESLLPGNKGYTVMAWNEL
jgi:hypothetical protein